MFDKLIFASLALQLTWATQVKRMVRSATCDSTTSGSTKCAAEKCNVWIGGKDYCSQCSTDAELLIDGGCAPTTSDLAKKCISDNKGKCSSCGDGYFLHRGGCYKFGTAPGNAVCTEPSAPGDSLPAGVCTTCGSGYFKNPAESAASAPPCIACNDTAGNSGNTGLVGCGTCDPPVSGQATCTSCLDGFFGIGEGTVTCTECTGECKTCKGGADQCTSCKTSSKYLKITDSVAETGECIDQGQCTETHFAMVDGGINMCYLCNTTDKGGKVGCRTCTKSGTVTCKTCLDGFFGTTDCVACHEDCLTCKIEAAKCTSCKADTKPYFKEGADNDQTGTCVDEVECKGDHFSTIDTSNSDKKICVPCSKTDKGGITNCKTCAFKVSSTEERPAITCTECTTNNLSPLKDECMAACPAGTYANNKVCASCHSSCAGCQTDDKETSCTACYPGYSLLYEPNGATGRCVKECTGAFITNCADGQCTADVGGGAKYCAQCKDGYAPIDGICTTMAAAGRDASVCTATGGKCTACTGAYALVSGGCYGVAKLPGKAVCTAANNGECTTCANGQQPSGKVCPACPAGCSKCAAGSSPQQCSECFPGYYKSGTKCVKCDKDSENIKGVPNCVSCKEPANSSGAVTCYLIQQKTDDGTGGDTGGNSMNKSGLSTGAIAGISVAVIVVVGGLVGFLCWWFICRGKA